MRARAVRPCGRAAVQINASTFEWLVLGKHFEAALCRLRVWTVSPRGDEAVVQAANPLCRSPEAAEHRIAAIRAGVGGGDE